MAHRGLLEDRLVERQVAGAALVGLAVDRHLEHHALLDLVGAGEEALERHAHAVGLDLAQVAELAHVDADHRDALLGDECHGAQHRAVAAQAEGDVEAPGERGLGRAQVGPGDEAGVLHREADLVTPLVEPGDRVAGQLGGLGPLVVEDDADGRHVVPCPFASASAIRRSTSRSISGPGCTAVRAWTRNSTLPSAPRSGDAIPSIMTAPTAR